MAEAVATARRRSALLSSIAAMLLCASAGGANDPCAARPFAGFDTRLTVRPLARLPEAKGTLAGFEVVRGVPLVLEGERLLALHGDTVAVVSLGRRADRMAVDAAGTLYFQGTSGTQDSMRRWLTRESEGRLVDVPGGEARGWLYGSGSHTFLEVERRGKVTLVALRGSGQPFPLARFEVPVRAAHWTDEGLAIIAGNRLYIWEQGAPAMSLVLTSPRLEKARAVSRAGKGRVVVAFEHMVALITPSAITPLVATDASCRYDGGKLYLFDHRSRTLIVVDGLDRLGTLDADRQHARALLSLQTQAGDDEAVRLIGCEATRRQRARMDALEPITSAQVAGGAEPASRVDSGLTVAPGWLTDSSLAGVVLRTVAAGSRAERGGLRAGDRIVSVNAKAVASLAELESALSLRNPATIKINRAEKMMSLTIHW